MKKTNFLLAAAVLFILAGCGASNDYTPVADATGEEIFSTACTGCHKPLSGSVAMILSEDMANKDAILNKVKSGSMRMPSFTNIQGEAADRLADYILANSQAK
ncbi:cytochrome c551 [Nitrosomonas cryotolerans]|uniref:Cytochrome c551 n=1 Tax=Nitrosomonas cryotolerans ATCC 49181 TaxID=1131553 RepID=A0A1N6FAX6_9PROT|nr:cytochrome c [Nitrosomonas cryotolerans]SFP75066.1 cytochrome c551 [Nitrosomonas cryotolerans]SIN92435.1 cytochrome c551 [Nitrosomonas cryotolerans ATCC 49181]